MTDKMAPPTLSFTQEEQTSNKLSLEKVVILSDTRKSSSANGKAKKKKDKESYIRFVWKTTWRKKQRN